MKHRLLLLTVALAFPACIEGAPLEDDDPTSPEAQARIDGEFAAMPRFPHRRVCDERPPEGEAACHARVRVDENGVVPLTALPTGYGPAELASAYALPASGGSGVTIALVDAYDDPNAEADLAKYRSTYNLPPCTTANGCFKKVNQRGQTTSLPAKSKSWASEIMVDLEVASAVCPSCKLLLVEANSASLSDLGTAENQAATLGAKVISNSYGAKESSGVTSYESYFTHAGVAIFVSAGDGGYGVEYPASSPHVIAVGGTSLRTSNTVRGWIETTWGSGASSATAGGTGSGCSSVFAKPSWQKDTGCAKRTVADISALADPNTGIAVYDSYGIGGWGIFGGTSVAAPLSAAIFALTGHASATAAFAYQNLASFWDVTTGSDGTCSVPYLCAAASGYDGPTGVGTPNGAALAGPPVISTPAPDAGAPPPPPPPVSTCAHSLCSAGGKLSAGCDSCAAKVCARDRSCCATSWSSRCVAEVATVCHQTCP